MELLVTLIDENNGKWGWKVKGEGIEGGGKNTANDRDEAEAQSKDFVATLLKAEVVDLNTDSIRLQNAIRTKGQKDE